MNNILYVTKYANSNHMCSSITYSLLNQNNKINILALFDNYITKDLYYNYFLTHSDQVSFIASNPLKSNLLKEYLSKYRWFVFLSTDCLYDRDYHDEIDKFCSSSDANLLVSPQNYKYVSNRTVILTNQSIKQHIINEDSIDDILQTYNSPTSSTRSVISFKSIALECYTSNTNVLHEDNYCLFGNFISKPQFNLVDSFVYINKNNHRVYNIANNVVGQLVNRTENSINITWQNDQNELISITYTYDPLTKSYINY